MTSRIRFVALLTAMLMTFWGMGQTALAQNMTENDAYANVVICSDAECSDPTDFAGMEGATITSLDADGVEIDSCAVETFVSGMDGCVLVKHDGTGGYAVGNLQDGYQLLSDEPDVAESESHGTQLTWYAAPVAAEAPVDSVSPVEELPETGIGIAAQTDLLIVALLGVSLVGTGATIMRRYGQEI